MLRLIVVYEVLLEILQHDLKNKLGFQGYVFVGNLGNEEIRSNLCM